MIMKMIMVAVALTIGCTTEFPMMHNDEGSTGTLNNMYPDVVKKTFVDWNMRGLEATSGCDPRKVRVEVMNNVAFDALKPGTCGLFEPNTWTIRIPANTDEHTVEHEVVHWLAGCTKRWWDYDARHRDPVLYGPTGISTVGWHCNFTVYIR